MTAFTGFFSGEIREEDLRNTAALVAAYRQLVDAPGSGFQGTEDELASVLGLAEHCLRSDKSPRSRPAVFVARLKRRDFDLTCAEKDAGFARLKTWRRLRTSGLAEVPLPRQQAPNDGPTAIGEVLNQVTERLVGSGV